MTPFMVGSLVSVWLNVVQLGGSCLLAGTDAMSCGSLQGSSVCQTLGARQGRFDKWVLNLMFLNVSSLRSLTPSQITPITHIYITSHRNG